MQDLASEFSQIFRRWYPRTLTTGGGACGRGRKRLGFGTQTLVPLNFSAVVAPLHLWTPLGEFCPQTRYLPYPGKSPAGAHGYTGIGELKIEKKSAKLQVELWQNTSSGHAITGVDGVRSLQGRQRRNTRTARRHPPTRRGCELLAKFNRSLLVLTKFMKIRPGFLTEIFAKLWKNALSNNVEESFKILSSGSINQSINMPVTFRISPCPRIQSYRVKF